jgi:lysophospholipase L1-like esterase
MRIHLALFGALLACGPAIAAEPTPAEQVAQFRHQLADWAQEARYRDANAALPPPASGSDRVVFMGDSITDFWGPGLGGAFPGRDVVNRGISGQTTPQMLVRFRPDVIALKPRVVVILAGTNDIAGNTGPTTTGRIEDNLASMAELARAHGIRVVLASVMPVNNYSNPDETTRRPPATIIELNHWLRDYATREHFVYLDYHAALLDDRHLLRRELSEDGLHPNKAGYAVMAPLADKAIRQALAASR